MTRITASSTTQHTTAGPYSPSLRVRRGDLLVLSGQGPLDEDGQVVGDNIQAQTRVTLGNCRRQLEAAGASLEDVFKVQVYLADLGDWAAFNDEYKQHFADPLPVRTTVGVNLLLGMRIEIDVWAAP